MNGLVDKQSNKTIINKNVIIFYTTIFIIALISGTFFNLILNDSDTKIVSDYLSNFLLLVKTGNINYLLSFLQTLLLNSIYIISIWLLGFTVIGIPIIMIIYFLKIFILGFSISALIFNFKIKGILYSFIYLFPHSIINLILIIVISIMAIYVSSIIYKNVIRKKKTNYKNILKKYLLVLFIFLFITILTTLYEVLLLPKVFNLLI